MIADEAIVRENAHGKFTLAELRERLEKAAKRDVTVGADLDLPETLEYLRAVCRCLSVQASMDYAGRCQTAAAAALFRGTIIDMANGEGKTLAGALAAALRAITGMRVHIAIFNNYLLRRDASWMWPIFDALGLAVCTRRKNLAGRTAEI